VPSLSPPVAVRQRGLRDPGGGGSVGRYRAAAGGA